MRNIRIGIIAGLIFGILDVLPMLAMEFSDPWTAMTGAFFSRFAIGFLIPQVRLPLPNWIAGALVGLLISIPDAVITGTYTPILVTGIVGGAVIGWITGRVKRRDVVRTTA